MNDFEFNMSILKVTSCFPQFGEKKSRILFEKVQNLDAGSFSRVCDRIILNSKTTPSIAEFIEQINLERKASYVSPIDSGSRGDSSFSKDEISEFFGIIKGLAYGRIRRAEGEQYSKMIRGIVDQRAKKAKCICEDGLVFARPVDNPNCNAYVFKCQCSVGQERAENYSQWTNSPNFVLAD